MIRNIELITEVDIPNINGVIYRKEVMEKMVDRFNQPKFIPVVVNINQDEYGFPPVGRVISESAIFDGKKITLDVDIEEHAIDLLESGKYIIGTYIIASLNDKNEVSLNSKFDIIEVQIINGYMEEK